MQLSATVYHVLWNKIIDSLSEGVYLGCRMCFLCLVRIYDQALFYVTEYDGYDIFFITCSWWLLAVITYHHDNRVSFHWWYAAFGSAAFFMALSQHTRSCAYLQTLCGPEVQSAVYTLWVNMYFDLSAGLFQLFDEPEMRAWSVIVWSCLPLHCVKCPNVDSECLGSVWVV